MPISRQPVTCAEILQRFPQYFVASVGDLKRPISGVTSPDSATSNDMVFLATPKALASGLASQASVLVVSPKSREQVEAQLGSRTLLIANNVEVAMTQTISEFFLKTPYTNSGIQNVHATAIVDSTATLGANVRIGPHVFIGADVKIGANTYIGANSVIEDKTQIGESTVIHPLVFVGHSTVIGSRCEIHPHACVGKEGYGYAHDQVFNHYKVPHQGFVVIEDDVHLGAGCTIDRGTFGETRICSGTKFDNQVHLAHNTKIGKNSLLTAGVVVAGSTTIGANFVSGGLTAITGHIKIGDNIQIGGLSAVTKGIEKPGAYAGNPLQPVHAYAKTKAAMTHLFDLQKQVKRISKHLGLDQPLDQSNETKET